MLKRNRSVIIICTFLFAIILSGAVAADTFSFSSDGKNITITPPNVPSTLKTVDHTVIKQGTYGYGRYDTITIYGKDNTGFTVNSTLNYFNNKFKTSIDKLTDLSGILISMKSVMYSTYDYQTLTGTGSSSKGTLKVTGTGKIPYHTVNGQQLLNNGVMNVGYYINGTNYAKCKITNVFGYKLIKGVYRNIKLTTTTSTVYANGNTRTSIITKVFTRNSMGTETGMVTTGTSHGIEKINGKNVSYTGKITISTRYDPKDIMNEKYDEGTYKEVRTSSSPTLLKEVPLDT